MANDLVTYKQLDELLKHLGFACQKVPPRWKRYEHAASDTVIILGDQKPTEAAIPSEVVSARRHLIEKGLISEEELDRSLTRTAAQKKDRAGKKG